MNETWQMGCTQAGLARSAEEMTVRSMLQVPWMEVCVQPDVLGRSKVNPRVDSCSWPRGRNKAVDCMDGSMSM